MPFLTNLKGYKSQKLKKKNFDSNENSFKIKLEKIKHGYLSKQLMYSFKSKVDTTTHSYLP